MELGLNGEACDEGPNTGSRTSLCTAYCEVGAVAVTEVFVHEMPRSAASLFPALGLTRARGRSIVTTNWDDDGLQVLLDMGGTNRVENLHQYAQPTGVAITGEHFGRDSDAHAVVVWMERYSDAVGATKVYVGDLFADQPVVRALDGYPFPQAAGGLLFMTSSQTSLVVVDQTRDPVPVLLLSTYDLITDTWAGWELGPAPAPTLRFASGYGRSGLSPNAGGNIARFFDGPNSFAFDKFANDAAAGPRGPWAVIPLAADFGFFNYLGTFSPIVLADDGRILVVNYELPDPELGHSLFATVSPGTNKFAVANVNQVLPQDVVVLRPDGVLTVLVNNGNAQSLLPQDFHVLPPSAEIALTARSGDVTVSSGTTLKILDVDRSPP